EALYWVCATTDAAYTAPAAFGLARVRAARGDTDAAVAALDMVSPTRRAYPQAQLMRAQVAAGDVDAGPVAATVGEVGPGLEVLADGADAEVTEPEPPVEVVEVVAPRRLCQTEGPVDFWVRVPSSPEQVRQVCQQITDDGPGGLVDLSGIDWRVLKVTSDQALLLADRVVATGPYHNVLVDVTWERCFVRRWLNDDFLGLLGEPLASRVVPTHVLNTPSPTWGTDAGPDTDDQVFVLSAEEAASWLAGKDVVTWGKYAGARRFGQSPAEHGLAALDEDGTSTWWWLRTPGDMRDTAAYVYAVGSIFDDGAPVSATGGIRPAMWLDLTGPS
ncbi:MAG: DUF6273 domain-containing protein, partial [Micrococcales bacterium]|nr:DUF6273 domain-containing protein [Micrococcales bacterium]